MQGGPAKLQQVFDRLGVPIAEEKVEGPSVSLTFLGIELDTRRMIRSLPAHKLTVTEFVLRMATKEGLESQGVAVLGGQTATRM